MVVLIGFWEKAEAIAIFNQKPTLFFLDEVSTSTYNMFDWSWICP